MNKAIAVEMQFFLISILAGVIIIFVYDIIRIFRRLIKHNNIFIAIEDLIFWVLSSLFIFIMMYQENDGVIRAFSIIGMIIGMVLYHFLISNIFITVSLKIIKFLFSPIVFVINWVKRILKFILRKVNGITHILLLRLKKIILSVKIVIINKKQKRKQKRDKLKQEKRAKQAEARKQKEMNSKKQKKTLKEKEKEEKNPKQEGVQLEKVQKKQDTVQLIRVEPKPNHVQHKKGSEDKATSR